ncbi:MAG: UvrD-helicase domain-containing protein, partial [Chlamydiae bacterium]|nr:UvrD-helicase domain-containing protein [Chlamydiota bacterium]
MEFNILDRNLPIFQNYFLEASAGTGKTFTIQQLIVRLIIEGNNPLTLDQILAVTFTREAARELKRRVRANLEEVIHLLRGNHRSQWDYLNAILDRGIEEVKKTMRRAEEALLSFDRAAIFTIHGFCFRMVSEFAFEANVPFSSGDIAENKMEKEILESVKELLSNSEKMDRFSPSQISSLLRKYRYDFDRIFIAISQLIFKPHKEETISIDSIREEIKRFSFVEKSKFIQDFQTAIPLFKRLDREPFHQQAFFLANILEKGIVSSEEVDFILEQKEWFLEKMDPSNLKSSANLDRIHFHYPKLFFELNEKLTPLLNKIKDPKQILFSLAKTIFSELEQKSEDGEIFHPDLLLKQMETALDQKPFSQKISQKYKALIVDEFQDTDPIQWAIFQKLFLGKNHLVYLVGDPKQSIYGFRNADLPTYMDALKQLGKESHVSLTTNFRSHPNLIHGLNLLLSDEISSNWLNIPNKKITLSYKSVKAGLNFETKEGNSSIHFFLAKGNLGRERSWPNRDLEEETLFPFIADEILHLRQKTHSFHDIAILVKDRFQGSRLQAFLEQRQIPTNLKNPKVAEESLALKEMEAFLQLMESPTEKNIKRILAGPFFNFSYSMILDAKKSEIIQKMQSQLVELRALFKEKGFGAAFHAFLFTDIDGKPPIKNAIFAEGLSFYQNLRSLSESLMEEDALHRPSHLLKILE